MQKPKTLGTVILYTRTTDTKKHELNVLVLFEASVSDEAGQL